jgi:hypothetical protein
MMSRTRWQVFTMTVLALVAGALSVVIRVEAAEPPRPLARPVEDGPFLRPAEGTGAEPVWGIKGGIAVGLWPTGGPRGLIRIYTPYLGQGRRRVMNFIAVEPVVRGVRGLSELEASALDHVDGKAMWTGDTLEDDPKPRPPWQQPARGLVSRPGGRKRLSFYIYVEPFDNGARPVVEVVLWEDRPHEITFRVFSAPGGAAMRSCVLTATMGNCARLRRVWLKDRIADAHALYRSARFDTHGFTDHHQWGIDELLVVDGEAVVAARPDEPDPVHVTYASDVHPSWHYVGQTATQYWRAPARPNLVARVNARKTYWASKAAIPGGVAFENFELEAPFRPGQKLVFGITPELPEALGFHPR